ncbi:hypothetical protein BDZ91DRAFT_784543 [Kalaharituber pfeilii]|nr:hypothetical protein BDZ91DRAFT_784543 [Kalaharituber pfeilii]
MLNSTAAHEYNRSAVASIYTVWQHPRSMATSERPCHHHQVFTNHFRRYHQGRSRRRNTRHPTEEGFGKGKAVVGSSE